MIILNILSQIIVFIQNIWEKIQITANVEKLLNV